MRGLLALPGIEKRIDDHRVLDYLIPEFDRTDQVSSFFQGISRLPAGHAMRVTARGVETWRWWRPAELAPQRFASLAECTEAFMAQLEEVVKPRLRSLRPVGAMLSGGMDSSTLVGLISHRLRGSLSQPLRTVSLIRDDRDNCPDWASIQAILQADPWLQPTILTTAKVNEVWEQLLAAAALADDPFAIGSGLPYHLAYQAASEAGCGVLLDGMAGDLMFHDGRGTLEAVVRRRLWGLLPGLRQTYRNHQWPLSLTRDVIVMAARVNQPDWLRGLVRRRLDSRRLAHGDLSEVPPQLARDYLDARRTPAYRAGAQTWQPNDQADHANRFTTGLNSFGHETYGPLAFACGVEPRSPYSDRRLIEFGIRMPLEAKLAIPWYKQLLRAGTGGLLPEATRWRRDIGSHPGWTYYDRLASHVPTRWTAEPNAASGSQGLQRWFRPDNGPRQQAMTAPDLGARLERLRHFLLISWLGSCGLD
jgi:asparagine synthase (glutamine-hydrolysing)